MSAPDMTRWLAKVWRRVWGEAFLIPQRQYNIPYEEPDPSSPAPSVAALVPDALCLRHMVVPIGFEGDKLKLLMANPLDTEAEQDVMASTLTVSCFMINRISSSRWISSSGTTSRLTQCNLK